MGIGVIVRDHLGMISVALSQTVEACPEPVIAEAMVALRAGKFCRDLGVQDTIFEGGFQNI